MTRGECPENPHSLFLFGQLLMSFTCILSRVKGLKQMGDFPHPLLILYQTQYSLSSFFQSFFIFFVDSTHPPLPVWHPVRTYSYRPSIKDHKESHGELQTASSVVFLLHLHLLQELVTSSVELFPIPSVIVFSIKPFIGLH